MKAQDIELVRNTFAVLVPHVDAMAARFYARLFELDPGVRALFRGDLGAQGRKLMQTIGVAVAALDRFETLVPTLHALGARHAELGVEDRHYDVVGSALLATFRELLGDRFTDDVCAAWAAVYTAVASAMKEGEKRPQSIGTSGSPSLSVGAERIDAVASHRRAREARARLIGDLIVRAATAVGLMLRRLGEAPARRRPRADMV